MRLLARSPARPRTALRCSGVATAAGRRHLTNNGFFRVSEEVREALNSKKPVVALETTIYTHGFPYPENVALASLLESVVRTNGGVPATIGILDGVARVGMGPEELIRLASSAGQPETLKLSRRDLGYVCGMRLANKSFNGGTTISGTMLLAHLAGIKIFGTGGLGGVHRGAESSMDISADLTELGRTPVTVVSSGCKSFLDIPRTIEYLETEGVGVGTFADGRQGNVDFPAFWSRDSGVKSPTTIADEMEAAAIIHAQHTLQISSGLLFANPAPTEFAIPKEEMDVIIEEALQQAKAANISGKDNTPFVLNKIKELSKGKSIPANRALIESNVRRATIVARELAVLESQQEEAQGRTPSLFAPVQSSPASTKPTNRTSASDMPRNASPNSTVSADRVFGAEFSNPSRSQPSRRPQGLDFDELMELTNSSSSPSEPLSTPANSFISTKEALPRADVVVAGALAVDFSCDYAPFTTATSQTDPLPHTSNPAVITQTLGGVAHNIAKAVHLLGTPVRLHSAVGDDLSGRAALAQLREEGMSVSGIETLPAPSRTAQYVAVNNANKDLALAMADMSILETIPKDTVSELASSLFLEKPLFPRDEAIQEVFVADANWSSEALHNLLGAVCYPATTATTIFEPVSTAKALRIFPPKHFPSIARSVFPQRLADIITPNNHELIALHDFALSSSYFELLEWFKVIDALGIPSSGLRVPLAVAVGSELVDEGIPQMAIKLLPFLPTILTKLGSRGVLMVKLLRAGAPELQDDSERQYVLARNMSADSNSAPSGDVDVRRQVGGLYVRLFPVDKVLRAEEVVSVNGIGDTFCGALASGLSKGRRVQDVVAFAQRAAGLSLQSRESVSPALRGLQWS